MDVRGCDEVIVDDLCGCVACAMGTFSIYRGYEKDRGRCGIEGHRLGKTTYLDAVQALGR